MTDSASLFAPLAAGALSLPNRIVMAPLTRARSTRDHVPTPRMATYYAQRASAGLIISEATGISPQGLGWPYAPGLWNAAQVEAWKPITAAVHEAGGRIVAQLWHMGRVVHSSVTGEQPVSSSATTAPDHAHTYEGNQPYEQARPLGVEEIPGLLEDYRKAARNALEAGFDGVEIHGANGYLIDQFLRDGTNARTDDYGGSIENRARLLFEVVNAVVGVVGADRTGLRLSPNGDAQGVIDSNPEPLFAYVATELEKIGLAYLHLRESRPGGTFRPSDQAPLAPVIRKHFTGALILNGDYTADRAAATVAAGEADAIAFGRPFIANPDLVSRIRTGAPLNAPNPSTFYSQGDEGYTDYPVAVPA
ncbi:alkene reductase [Sphingobium sp. CR28]|uniref:alkene reductase n=1 Tax=Sphingobium sp. CR28 TaxID=3400272 RepID=UPI003FF06AEB